MTSIFQVNSHLPLDKNCLHPDFDFAETFLLDFDNIVLSHRGSHLINSQKLYLSNKNEYTRQCLERNNQFIELSRTLVQLSNTDRFNFDTGSKESVKRGMKDLFKSQVDSLDKFLHYLEYILSHS